MPLLFNLDRFVKAQEGTYEAALAELRAGAKRTHWMWFVFPQVAGLGQSDMAKRYALASKDEARAYLAHPVLGPRLLACVDALQALGPTRTAEAVLGSIDAMKLRSSLTLFAEATQEPRFTAALARWFEGQPDPKTLRILNQG